MPETTYCPVCGSKATYFQLSGSLTCQDCGLIYKSITKETINNPEAILEARRLLYRRLRNPKEFAPRTKEELARDKHVNLYFVCETPNKLEILTTGSCVETRQTDRPTCPVCASDSISYETRGVSVISVCQDCGNEECAVEDRFKKTFKDFDKKVQSKSAKWPEGDYIKVLKDHSKLHIPSPDEIDSMLYARRELEQAKMEKAHLYCPNCGSFDFSYEPPQHYVDSVPIRPYGLWTCNDCGWDTDEEPQKTLNEIRKEHGFPPIEDTKCMLKDSGARREFDTGAVRDISEGKGRCDLLPLDVVSELIGGSSELCAIEKFKEAKDINHLKDAICIFAEVSELPTYTLMLEVSKHFEQGALKYDENNWKKGIPLHCYLDSAVRHYLKHLRGDTDEPHDRAFVWNLLCAIWTFTHKPELDDVERDLVKEDV